TAAGDDDADREGNGGAEKGVARLVGGDTPGLGGVSVGLPRIRRPPVRAGPPRRRRPAAAHALHRGRLRRQARAVTGPATSQLRHQLPLLVWLVLVWILLWGSWSGADLLSGAVIAV